MKQVSVIQLGTSPRTFANLFLKSSSLIINECLEEILIKLAIVLKISKSN